MILKVCYEMLLEPSLSKYEKISMYEVSLNYLNMTGFSFWSSNLQFQPLPFPVQMKWQTKTLIVFHGGWPIPHNT